MEVFRIISTENISEKKSGEMRTPMKKGIKQIHQLKTGVVIAYNQFVR